jgi:predicted MFS family arabinose efflux permease
MFTAYTYLADSMERIGNYEPSTVGWALIGFGGAGIVGNAFAGRALDGNPMGASITAAAIVGAAMAASASTIASPFGAAIVLVLWGAAHAASFVANHVRVIKAAPAGYEEIAASLNVSVFNAGIGMGAVVGGRLIDAIGLSHIGLGAGAIIVVALGHGTLLQRATGVNAEVAGSS